VTGPGLHFRRRHRLAHALDYQRVYAGRARKSAHPIVLFAAPNALAHPRLGLSVGRRVGKAHQRVAIKRRLREAFRLVQHDLPAWAATPQQPRSGVGGTAGGRYDYVVQVRPHADAPTTADLAARLVELANQCHGVWERRRGGR